MKFILRCLALALAVSVVIWIIPGVDLVGGNDAWGAIALFSVILALVNSSLKPLLQTLSLPITFLTLGIFYLVVNTLMLYLSGWLANSLFHVGFVIESFGSGFVASIVISIISGFINAVTGANKKTAPHV